MIGCMHAVDAYDMVYRKVVALTILAVVWLAEGAYGKGESAMKLLPCD